MTKEKTKVKNKKKPLIITGIVIGSLVLIYAVLSLVNLFLNLSLRSYIKEYCAPITVSDKLEPKVDSDGHYYFETDRDFKVVQLTDIHFGGGFLSYSKDKKTIRDVYDNLKETKPDLVILTGDNIFAIPYISGTFNNKMASKTIVKVFEASNIYFTTAFGNHDTEVFDYTSRQNLGKMYESLGVQKYSLFKSEHQTKGENGLYSVTNQLIYLKRTDGTIAKAFFTIDTNAYKDNSIKSVLDWTYDLIREDDVTWARNELDKLNQKNNGNKVQTMFFFHIPIAEYQIAYEELVKFDGSKYVIKNTTNSKYLGGVWDETVEENYGGVQGNDVRIWYGGCYDNTDIASKDKLFESFTNEMIACFCGHDHVNNAAVSYKGKLLSYGNSIDNLAYDDIEFSGKQRGCTLLTIKSTSNDLVVEHKNLYTDLNKNAKEDNVYTDKQYYNSESLSGDEYNLKDSMAGSDLDKYPTIVIDGSTGSIEIK